MSLCGTGINDGATFAPFDGLDTEIKVVKEPVRCPA
jgi:hypothetical protein